MKNDLDKEAKYRRLVLRLVVGTVVGSAGFFGVAIAGLVVIAVISGPPPAREVEIVRAIRFATTFAQTLSVTVNPLSAYDPIAGDRYYLVVKDTGSKSFGGRYSTEIPPSRARYEEALPLSVGRTTMVNWAVNGQVSSTQSLTFWIEKHAANGTVSKVSDEFSQCL